MSTLKINPMMLTDFYKVVHHKSYTENLEFLYSYWTPRMSRKEGIDKVVLFGLQAFVQEYLIDMFNDNFFNVDKETLIAEYKETLKYTMNAKDFDTSHIEELHDLGYLPIAIKALAEGTRVPILCPMFELTNTLKGFAWLVNYIETLMSCSIWSPMTSATIAYQFKELVDENFEKTVSNRLVKSVEVISKKEVYTNVDIEDSKIDSKKACGDFSMRGMSSVESACSTGAGHLLSFTSTATIPSIKWLEKYYDADLKSEEIGFGTASMEHSVMSSYGKDKEFDSYKRLITEIFPSGNLSIVSDTYDYFNVITNMLPKLKEDILERDGKIIIRGDSGDPVEILCGIENPDDNCPNELGTVRLLWNIFGGYVNDKGYKVLNSKIGAIYGDSITYERATKIYDRLEKAGFAANNVVLGIGSYTYQFNTRDTFGFALKATHSIVAGKDRHIFKDPITDTGNFKKSQRGMCFVYLEDGEIKYKDGFTLKEIEGKEESLLVEIFRDGKFKKKYSLKEIKERLHN